ncbi:MAG: glycosyltransferase family 39 protein [Alphaproteobacteria bacterium]|nr:glycosyltransferase family 39 protein [Alphaproteobacteria bacterium]
MKRALGVGRAWAAAHRIALLKALFASAVAFRIAYVFHSNPLGHRYSDAMRHWHNGVAFFTPDVMGSVDPLLYQVWVYGLHRMAGENPTAIALATGALSALMPWCWYRGLRELMPHPPALAGGILIALMPSTLGIYSYFVNETLLLTLEGLAVWLSFRAYRKQTVSAWALAGLAWALACYTRSIAMPLAAGMLGTGWLMMRASWPARAASLAAAAAPFFLLAPASCWHSELKLHYCAAFGNDSVAPLYHMAHTKGIVLNFPGEGGWGFTSPAVFTSPLAPFYDWHSPRLSQGDFYFTIDTKQGRKDWERALQQARLHPFPLREEIAENLLYLVFERSWPDDDTDYAVNRLSIWLRFLWCPLWLYAAWGALTRKLSWRERLLPLLCVGMLVLLAFQESGVMEGRYRKPLEPLLLASAVVLARRRSAARQRAAYSPSAVTRLRPVCLDL